MSGRLNDENVIVPYPNLLATAVACDSTGQYAILCGSSLVIINLDNPREILQSFPRSTRHEISAIQWNPHTAFSHFFLSVTSQNVELWRWDAAACNAIQTRTLRGHRRTITDLDWSSAEPNIAATCSIDTDTCLWDIRDFRKPTTTLQSVVCPSQVKWNKQTERILATTHEGDMKIWDLRKSNTPVHYISAHAQKVNGLDWSPFNEKQVATCSQDSTLKIWDLNNPKEEETKIQSKFAFLKLKYTPFGAGIVTSYVPQTGIGSVCLWSLNKLLKMTQRQPLFTFGSHGGGIILDFCFRKINSDYQLISWSNEHSLKLCQIDHILKQRCGNGQFTSLPTSNSTETTPEREIIEMNSNDANQTSNVDRTFVGRRRKTSANRPMSLSNDIRQTSSSSAQHPKTLLQEFTLLNAEIPDITIVDMNSDKKTLTVRALNGFHEVHLTISFPLLYPIKTSPEFFFLEDTTIDPIQRAQLIEGLQTTALQHVQHNRCCIEPCLWKLVNTLDMILQESKPIPDLDISHLQRAADLWSPYSSEKLRDENVPFPRISGARFCGPGFLVCFTRRMLLDVPHFITLSSEQQQKRKDSESGVTPRAMSALSDLAQPTRIPSNSSIMRSYYGLARSLPSDSNVPSVSQYYQLQDQKPQKNKNKPRSREQQKQEMNSTMTTMTSSKRNLVGPVIVYDLSSLLPVQKQLGDNYVLYDDKNRLSMCRKNCLASAAAGRKDLIQVWSLAAAQIDESLRSEIDSDKYLPWSFNPFGRQLIKYWLDYYSAIHDVQTLAMLCSVFDWKNNSSPSALIPSSVASPATGHPLPLPPPPPLPPTALPVSNIEPLMSYILTSDAVNNDTTMMTSVRKMRRSNSWSETTFDGTNLTIDSNDVIDFESTETEEFVKNSKLLDPVLNIQYDLFKKSYSNILYQWGHLTKKTELLNFLHTNPSEDAFSFCTKTRDEEEDELNESKKSLKIICILCHMRVEGLFSLCLLCGHGGHLMHLIEWFYSHTLCASGCGCECISMNHLQIDS